MKGQLFSFFVYFFRSDKIMLHGSTARLEPPQHREGGDIGLFVTLVPHHLITFSYLMAKQLWGLVLNFDWLVHYFIEHQFIGHCLIHFRSLGQAIEQTNPHLIFNSFKIKVRGVQCSVGTLRISAHQALWGKAPITTHFL